MFRIPWRSPIEEMRSAAEEGNGKAISEFRAAKRGCGLGRGVNAYCWFRIEDVSGKKNSRTEKRTLSLFSSNISAGTPKKHPPKKTPGIWGHLWSAMIDHAPSQKLPTRGQDRRREKERTRREVSKAASHHVSDENRIRMDSRVNFTRGQEERGVK